MRHSNLNTVLVSIVFALVAPHGAAGQQLRIGIIDFYGLRNVTAERARAALTFKEGDPASLAGDGIPAALTTSERQLATLPRVRARADQCRVLRRWTGHRLRGHRRARLGNTLVSRRADRKRASRARHRPGGGRLLDGDRVRD